MATPSETGGDIKDLLIRILFTPIGLGLLVAAVFSGLSTHHFLQTAARAPGVVTQLNAGGSHPEIQFIVAGGKSVSYPQGGMIFGYKPGQKVAVLYDPHEPEIGATINDPGALWDAFGGFLFLGSVFFGIGLMTLRKRR